MYTPPAARIAPEPASVRADLCDSQPRKAPQAPADTCLLTLYTVLHVMNRRNRGIFCPQDNM
jgi:hypothetical protein